MAEVREPDVALGARGRRLWDALLEEADYGPRQIVLIEEACRLADRLDVLDDGLRNKSVWLDLFEDEDRGEVFLVVDKLLSEARQHALAFKQILSEVRQGGAEPKVGEVDPLDELARARADRLAAPAG